MKDTVLTFEKIYKNNLWKSKESRSGPGSELDSARSIINRLPLLFEKYNITSVLDIPCGDFNWMKEVDISNIIQYVGGDIVDQIVESNTRRYASKVRSFRSIDIRNDPLPSCDLIIVRELFGHLSTSDIWLSINNICKCDFKYILITNHPYFYGVYSNSINTKWRPINFYNEPFLFEKGIESIRESLDDKNYFPNIHLTMWKASQIKKALSSVPSR